MFKPSGSAVARLEAPQKPALQPSPGLARRGYHFFKRLIDVAVGLPLFLLTLPLQFLIAMLIRFESPGPALYRQQRLTVGERPFIFIKFRTMYVDARQRFPELYDYQAIAANGGLAPLKSKDDPRVTTYGRWLRKSSLDELPNLWNVIRGEMSLVGPRPETPELLDCYSDEQRLIFQVSPGVTGLAQCFGRNRLTVAETIALDLDYARTASFSLDLKILLRTIWQVLRGADAF
jgi:lipopolysaccharide/colanic/teichoic acid biosynthesis glycosyltransferase